jgi:hypothetical protein
MTSAIGNRTDQTGGYSGYPPLSHHRRARRGRNQALGFAVLAVVSVLGTWPQPRWPAGRRHPPFRFVIDAAGNTVTPPRGASDAFLMPYHVERGKIFVRERFAPVPFVDEERIAAAIELTRFPVPDDACER